jgi:hypothetical protein
MSITVNHDLDVYFICLRGGNFRRSFFEKWHDKI